MAINSEERTWYLRDEPLEHLDEEDKLHHKGEYTNLNETSIETDLFQPRWEKISITPKGIDSKNFRRYIPITDRRDVPSGIKFSVRSSDIPFEVLKSMMNLTEAQTEHLDEVYYILRKDGQEAVGYRPLVLDVIHTVAVRCIVSILSL